MACQYALYSVPASVCPPGQKVEIRLDSKLVRIYHRGKLVKIHQHQPRGSRATDPDDYPAEVSAYTTRAPDRIKRRAALQGSAVAEFAQRLDDACQRALDVDLIDVRRVERILVQALETGAMPQLPISMPAGRFARPGSVFAHAIGGGS